MPKNDIISRRQYMTACFVALLSQHIRVVPRALAAEAGRAAWLIPIASAAPVALYLLFLSAAFRKKEEGQSLCTLFQTALGRPGGRIAVALISLWMLFYTAFLLRNIAERFVSTVYPYSGTGPFIIAMGLLCLIAALGRYKAIARCAAVFLPALGLLIFAALGISLFSVDINCLLPITAADAVPVAKNTLRIVNILGLTAYMGFLEGQTKGSVRLRDYLPWIALLLLLSTLLCVCCIGMYGARLTAEATLPVFLLMRDLTIFGSVERVEPLIITVWVLCDFVLISTVLYISAKNLRWCLGIREGEFRRLTDMSCGRWLTPLCAAAAVGTALTLGKNIIAMDALSEEIVPGINLAVILVILPLVFLLARLRERRKKRRAG